MAQILVLDEAWSKIDPAQIKAAGYAGIIVYISRDTSKMASADYLARCFAAGLGVAFVFEDSAQRSLAGAPGGVEDGRYANTYLDGLVVNGQRAPADLPVYGAIDFDVSPSQMPTVVGYVRAFGSVKRPGRGYGKAAVVDALVAAGIPHDWQCCAWSGQYVDGNAVLYQRLRPTTNLAGSFDEDVVLADSLAAAGFWLPTVAVSAGPTPVPPAPRPAPKRKVAPPDMAARTLLVTRSDGAVFAVREDLSCKEHVGDPTQLGAMIATGDYVQIPRGKFSDAEINAIPDAS